MDIMQAIELLRQNRTPNRREDTRRLVSVAWSPPAPRPPELSARRASQQQPTY